MERLKLRPNTVPVCWNRPRAVAFNCTPALPPLRVRASRWFSALSHFRGPRSYQTPEALRHIRSLALPDHHVIAPVRGPQFHLDFRPLDGHAGPLLDGGLAAHFGAALPSHSRSQGLSVPSWFGRNSRQSARNSSRFSGPATLPF